jgi:hypothetical protein
MKRSYIIQYVIVLKLYPAGAAMKQLRWTDDLNALYRDDSLSTVL